MDNRNKVWMQRRRRIWEIIEPGTADDIVSRCYDVFTTLMTIINVIVTVMYTFDEMELKHGSTLLFLEAVTVAFLRLNMDFGSGQRSLLIRICQMAEPLKNTPLLSAVLLICCLFCLIICLFSFPPVQLCSGCSG